MRQRFRTTLIFTVIALLAPIWALSAAGTDDKEYRNVLLGGSPGIHRRHFSISEEKSRDGNPWIVMYAEYDAVMHADSGEILTILHDYQNAPSTFSRIERVDVLDEQGDKALTRQTTAFHVFGMTIASTMEFQIIYQHISPSVTVQRFSMIKSDSSTLKNEGSWLVEEMPPDSTSEKGPLCRVVYALELWVEPRYPLQEFIMRNFGPADIAALFKELAEAVQRNQTGLKRLTP